MLLILCTILILAKIAYRDHKDRIINDRDVVFLILVGFIINVFSNPVILQKSAINIMVLSFFGLILYKLKAWGDGDWVLLSAVGFVLPTRMSLYWGLNGNWYPFGLLLEVLGLWIACVFATKQEKIPIGVVVFAVVLLNVVLGIWQ